MRPCNGPGRRLSSWLRPRSTDQRDAGFPQIEKAEKYVIDHHLADVISQSFGATEQTFPNKRSIMNLRGAYVDAAEHDVTVLAASGDQGASDVRSMTPFGYVYFTHRTVDWPASDPLVTAVGGTFVDRAGRGRAKPDSVWNTTTESGPSGERRWRVDGFPAA